MGCLGIGEPKLIAPVFERMARGVFVFRDEKMESCGCGSLDGHFDGELRLVRRLFGPSGSLLNGHPLHPALACAVVTVLYVADWRVPLRS